ncbi:LytR/AlgR family response regulator transcription factor [Dinghuibacter silviterrae]|uniref:LytTR family two component transcriptional regulator n=1 Tax=Dinghuibacter silviterrae TaxID=1539049 RepID=A0A4R8DTG4_9BACT|nr:response regulator [Dinghuibacter silviterrae]TDX01196.1 LytTR family two component transcriptional regulator [Dinghuibacter silviterrae]
MNTIKSILVDDEPRGLSALKVLLKLHCPQVMVAAECRDAQHALEQIETLQPDLVFLDISMPGKSGLDLLNELRPVRFEIIFTTAHDEFMIQAFKYSAIDYLLKPVDEDQLVEAVKRAEERIDTKASSRRIDTFLYNIQKAQAPGEMKLCIPDMKGFRVILLADVVYCESDSSYTVFHLTGGQTLTTSKSIIDYELLLDHSNFCRVHKSFLVNLQHVREYIRGEGGSVVLSNGKTVEVSRRKKEAFIGRMKELFKY